MAKLLFPALGNPSPCTGHLVGIAMIPETRTVEMFWALVTRVFSAQNEESSEYFRTFCDLESECPCMSAGLGIK